MSKTVALIVGVSEYQQEELDNLPYCHNDVIEMRNALVQGLNVLPKDIQICGASLSVLSCEFRSALQQLSEVAEEDDIIILYFSGHGNDIFGEHYLELTDTRIKTQDLIYDLAEIPAKSKILFLDCCYAGNFEVSGSAVFDIEAVAEEFAGKGYVVFASSSVNQPSFSHPEKNMSLFTSLLCEALTSKSTIREGKKSLQDIHELLFLMVNIWNIKHPSKSQTPIYRANMGGTVFFQVEDYHPFLKGDYYYDAEEYTIDSVEPIHCGSAKRYVVKVILKRPMPFASIACINLEIVNKIKYLEIYNSEEQRIRWEHKPASLVFGYFGLDKTDLVNGNYLCHTTWACDPQDKKNCYKAGKNCRILKGINFCINLQYDSTKQFILEHTTSRNELITETKRIVHQMISLAEEIIALYNEYLNSVISESILIREVNRIAPKVNKLYFQETALGIPPDDMTEWSNHCSTLTACIHDFTIHYSKKSVLERTPENRKQCMNVTIKQYYSDLERLKEIEKDNKVFDNVD